VGDVGPNLDSFVPHLRAENKAPSTVVTYSKAINQLADYLEASGMPTAAGSVNVSDPATRERAALDVLALLPDRWALGPTRYDPGTGRWSRPRVDRIPAGAGIPRR
jgi:hypothetical protein